MKTLTQVPIGSTFGSPFGQGYSLGSLILLFIRISFIISGMILLFFFVFGGIKIIAGAGNSDPRSVGEGRQALTYAFVGLVVVFVAYWIVRIIEIITGVPFITAPVLQ
jgi:hypothetical protein